MRILRLKEVIEKTGLSRSTVYRLEQNGGFPKRKMIAKRAVGWIEIDINKWISKKETL